MNEERLKEIENINDRTTHEKTAYCHVNQLLKAYRSAQKEIEILREGLDYIINTSIINKVVLAEDTLHKADKIKGTNGSSN